MPGLTIQFGSDGILFVGKGGAGALRAKGTEAAPIVLTGAAAMDPGSWGGVHIEDLSIDADTVLEHVVVEYGGGKNSLANIEITAASPVISDTRIENSDDWGVYLWQQASPKLTNVTFANNPAGDVGPSPDAPPAATPLSLWPLRRARHRHTPVWAFLTSAAHSVKSALDSSASTCKGCRVPGLTSPEDPAPPPADGASSDGGAGDLAAPPLDPAATRTLRNLKIGAVAIVAIGLVVAWRLGLFEMFGEPARVKQALVALGPWGYLAFVVAYACLQPFGVPGTVFIMAAPLIWPWPVAFALSMAGTMAASVVGFSFARFVARDWVARLVPARFRAYDEALAKRGFVTVFTLRFVFWMPPMLHVFFGISRVPFWTHFWGSLVGYILPLLATAYFGQKVFDFLRDAPPSVWIGMAAVTAALIATFWLVRRRSRRSAPAASPPAG